MPLRKVRTWAAAALLIGAGGAQAATVEVLHWWTAGGEAKSVAELKRLLADQGHQWRDFAVAGGGGDQAMAVLGDRVAQGNAPAAAQIKGPAIQDWGRRGALANLDDIAREQAWDSQLPRVVSDIMKVDGHYAAVPVNVHRVNWLWINRDVLRRLGARPPATWDEFFGLAERMQRMGIVPVAHGGQPWQDFTTFETVVLSVGGADFYRRAFVQLDPAALRSPTMERALTTFRRIRQYTDRTGAQREWNQATAAVIKGDSAMQFMGDWAKGEFLAAGKKPGEDFLCVPAPGTDRAYIFNIDSFAMFQLKDPAAAAGQRALVKTIMSPEFQTTFNLNKGSIPAVTGTNRERFDRCGQESSAHFVASAMLNNLVPSIAHRMVQPDGKEQALREAVTAFWHDDRVNAAETMDRFVEVAKPRKRS